MSVRERALGASGGAHGLQCIEREKDGASERERESERASERERERVGGWVVRTRGERARASEKQRVA